MAGIRQAVASLDAAYVETTAAIHALQRVDDEPHAQALRVHLLGVLSLLPTIRDDKKPNARLIAAMEEARTLRQCRHPPRRRNRDVVSLAPC